MTQKEDIKSYSLKEIKEMREKGLGKTDPNAPTYEVDENFWTNATVVFPSSPKKEHTGIRLDVDVIEWFKSEGKGWQTRMNAVLRSYYESHHNHPDQNSL